MKRSKTFNYLLAIGLVVAFIGIGLAVGYSRGESDTNTGDGLSPQIEVEPAQLDWGSISAANGLVSQTVVVRNKGTGDLIVKKISTSCGCTTARLTTARRTTPQLGMDHGSLPPLREVIQPSEEATLTITYDPNFHFARGPITRVVYLVTNDPRQPEVEVRNVMVVTD